MSGIWVRGGDNNKRAPQDQSQVELVACRLAKAGPSTGDKEGVWDIQPLLDWKIRDDSIETD